MKKSSIAAVSIFVLGWVGAISAHAEDDATERGSAAIIVTGGITQHVYQPTVNINNPQILGLALEHAGE